MKSEWKVTELSNLVNELTVGFVGSMSQEYVDNGIVFFRSKNIKPYKLDWNDIKYISNEFHNKLQKSFLRPGDVVIVRTGNPGTSCVIPETIIEANCSDVVIARVNDEKLSAHFLSYFMNSIAKNQVSAHLVGAVQQDFNVGSAKKLKILLPSRNEQEIIVSILKTLDDKIELNRKMNQTLEEMAQTLFKSWFVDFDPVHAKAKCSSDEELETAAKELGISKEILELFPSEFEESELGMIPKGWEVKPLSSIAHYQNGLALQKFRPLDESNYLPVLKITQLNKGYADGEEKADLNINPECIVDSGDIIFSWSGTLIVDIWCGRKAALNQHLFKVTSKDFPKWFYYYWTKQHLYWFQHIAASKAVTMGHIKRSHLDEALCCIPTETVFAKAEDLIGRLVEKTISNRLEIQTLQKTRDTLLPKLLSGELDVSELELKV